MQVRRAAAEEMLALWGFPDAETASPTARFFYRNLITGNAVFWTLDNDGELAGELYAFLCLEDRDFADGRETAYLCAFRVKEPYRGQGYGTSMMSVALAQLKEMGFRYATIGVASDEPQNIRLYRRLGFSAKIRDCPEDPCARDENMQPVHEKNAFWLLKKTL
ncbi:MAG: GNAT family N-acetyltransferase [Clostridia bacterium]|nr:GNAT family N-acetyltransferase [Clostridia bacterium]